MKRTFKNFSQTNQTAKKKQIFIIYNIGFFTFCHFGLSLYFRAIATNYITKTTATPFMENNL